MSARVAVLGAGPAGLVAARRLAREPGLDAILVAPGGVARHHAGTLDVLLGADAAAFTHPVAVPNVQLIRGEASELRPGAVTVGSRVLEVDAVVVAVGLELELAAIAQTPGVAVAWDVPTAAAARSVLSSDDDPLVVAVSSVPYRCPPAPFSLAMRLARSGRTVTVLTPEEEPLAGVGGPAPGALRAAVAEAGIRIELGFELDLASGLDGVAVARDGRRVPFARALVIPPHRRPRFLNGLGDEPLVPIDPDGATRAPGIFAAGDVTAAPLPRAAGVAEAQGMTAAEGALAFLGLRGPRQPNLPAAECALDHGDGRFSRIAITFPDGLPPRGAAHVKVDGPSREFARLPLAAAARLRALAGGEV